jgi:STE24 endopeptidase
MNCQRIRTTCFAASIAVTFCAVILTPSIYAQQPAANGPATAPSSAQPPPGSQLQQSLQVQGYTLTPGQEAMAVAYARAEHELYFIDVTYGLLVVVLLLLLRVAPKFRDQAERCTRNQFGRTIIVGPLTLLTIDALSLPTAIWGHRLSLQYQQSIQGWGSWAADWAKGEAIQMAVGGVVIWILYAVIRKTPRRWWFYFWLAAVPLIILGAIAEPVIIEPVFFKFTPLANSQPRLAMRIEEVVQRAELEIPEDRMFVMNASSKLKSVNAYVSGLSATKRVVVWDTSLQRMTEDEILFVFGHEMGHYVLGHIWKGILFAAGVILVFLFVAHRALRWMLARWGESWSIRGVDDLASLPALILLATIFGFLFTPIANAFSRFEEHQADQYGLEVIHGVVPDAPVVAASAFQVLGEVDLEEPNPSPLVKFWFYNHPPLDERMRFAQTYNPWSEGKEPEFVK